ncbi:MAG: hypothetical protein ACOY3E_09020 [Pseudomonadota bacterium]
MTALSMVLALSGPAVVVAIVLAVLIIKRKAQDRRAVELLLMAVKAAEPAYREHLLGKLGSSGHADPDKLAALVDKLIKGRRQYFKQVLAALLDRKPSGLLAMEPALQQYSELHLQGMAVLARSMVPAPAVAEAAATAASGSGAATFAGEGQLRSENDRLRREVGLTLSALNNIFAEYASMFGDEHTRRDMSLEEILSSMQQLAAGEPPAAVDEPLPGSALERLLDDVPKEVEVAGDPFAEPAAIEADTLAASTADADTDTINEPADSR